MPSFPRSTAGFDHLVVLMLENRSFDHLLGFLYEGDTPRHFLPDGDRRFHGVSETPGLGNFDGKTPPTFYPVTRAPHDSLADLALPFPDPGEEFFPHMNHQIYGQDQVPESLSELPPTAPMSGFVSDYLRTYHQKFRRFRRGVSDAQLASELMCCFPPQATPVLSGLARAYSVSDAWFASVPSQTYANRSFLHAADSSGFVHNANYIKWSKNSAPTVFERLAERLPLPEAFRIYWDPLDPFPITRLIHRPLYDQRFDASFVDMRAFERDCAEGRLPAYAFVQPRVIVDNNDMHPSFLPQQNRHSSVVAGDALVARVYDALRTSPLWPRVLLVILFDEHGGTYDHVPPPVGATPPHPSPPYPLEHGFRFQRFGVRVPAVFVSPQIEPGTVVRARGAVPFDHTSVIKTLCLRFDLPSLTERDRAAPDFLHVLNRPSSSPPRDVPVFTPRPQPAPVTGKARRLPLSDLQRGTLELLAHQRGLASRGFATLGEALDLLHGLRRRRRTKDE